ncbi:protein PIH1D3 isoform X2 [Cryptotermes secundus]|uniref:protein PIH1D3 isoform X2 n=1 Tax=Cryptotermes secundus TaxID=105785 RepID=UPI001454CA59|nr:protein PIH1D3 isoform X2 [Cryptotermes secundus]
MICLKVEYPSWTGPGNIGPQKSSGDSSGAAAVSGDTADDINIWDEREVPEVDVGDNSTDPRERPEFDIKYRQAVTPEDVYLQMGGKTTGSASCEDMVVSVQLPGESRGQVNLAVTRERLDVRSPRYCLSLAMPHPVDPDSSRAEWLNSVLVVTLRMQRDFDFINF